MFCCTSKEEPYEHHYKGWQLYYEDDHKGAIKYFLKYLAVEPGDFNMIYWTGVALSLDKQYDLALKYYNLYLMWNPGQKSLIEERDNIIKDIQENQQNVQQAQLKLKNSRIQSDTLSKGNRLYNKKNYKGAREFFLQYLAVEPGDFDTIYRIGKTLSLDKQYDAALKYYDFCLKLQKLRQDIQNIQNIISERAKIEKEIEEAEVVKQQLRETQSKIKKSQIQPCTFNNGSVPVSNYPQPPLIFSSGKNTIEKKKNGKKKTVTFNPEPEIVPYESQNNSSNCCIIS